MPAGGNVQAIQEQAQNSAQGNATSSASRELLTFTLGREEYGIDILKVQEIRGYDAVTSREMELVETAETAA
jgi:chemotaxis signal transduction protein